MTFFLVSTKEICSLALNGQQPSDAAQRESMPLMWLIVTMVNIVQNNIFSLPLVKRSIRKSSDKQAGVCLKIWQELTTLQSVLAHYKYKEISQSSEVNHGRTRFLATVGDGIGDILSIVQRMLPTPHFLASVSSLLSDPGTSVEIQKRAIQLLAERSAEMNMSSPEASLFIEMIPDLVDMTRTKSSKAKSKKNITDSPVLRQISFRAIDHVAKNLGLGAINEKTRRKRSGVFLPAFECVASFLRSESGSTRFNKISDDDMDESQSSFLMQSQVLSSAALCAATLITLLQARCLAQLQTLVKPVISILIDVNNCIRDNDKILIGGTNHQALKLVQLSVTRTLVAVAESIPQFFTPFIEALLATSCLPSINIRQDTSDEGIAVNEMAERLENAIATLCPVHQLIPTLSKVTRKCFNNENTDDCWREAISILKILKKTISKSSRSDLNPLAGKVLNALVQTYGHDCKEGRSQLLKEANETLLSLVMKLSESQLRPLYARLREWRGEFDPSDENENLACKRFAFWSLSAAICQKLRNIFLPCMSSVLGDIIKELDYIASCLCQSSSQTRGNKRQKTQDISMLLDVDKLSPLQPLLLCLESALKADAHEGGNWIRSEDGQRYRMVLEPLGKLLQATIPSDFYVISDDENNQRKSTTTYEMLIEGVGTEEQGSVSQTLTALAAAAGNEQLWKPLNYSLLQACGNGKRAEVRKTGVKSLLNIIQTLGEEYMVLLPECLPVLSELLEDEDESIIALAKECIHQGEELLGESLEDSLR
jgi:U3 small nucleolar RNA-associated protein 10